MRRTGILSILLALAFSLAGCGSTATSKLTASNSSNMAVSGEERAPGTSDTETAAMPSAANAAANVSARAAPRRQTIGQKVAEKITLKQSEDAVIDTSPTDRKIIRNADLTLETEVPENAQREITALAERAGGFVVDSQSTSSDLKSTRRDVVTMSVRVPAANFADTLDGVRKAGTAIITESVKGDDVTEEFIDVEARLRAKKALEMQYLEIMKRANNVDDALNVHGQIADVRSEIERIEGRKRFLENQSNLSTIKVRLQTSTATTIAASSSGFVPRLSEAFNVGVTFALNFLLGLMTVVIAVLPFAVFIGFPIFLLVRYIWKRRDGPKSVSQIVKDEINAS